MSLLLASSVSQLRDRLGLYMSMCVIECVCVNSVRGLKPLCSVWMLSVPVQSRPLWSLTTDRLTAVFVCFLAQKGPSDLELVPEEYSVMIGSYPCNISFHNDQLFHCTINGLLSSSERELPVTVSLQACKTTKTLPTSCWKYCRIDPDSLRISSHLSHRTQAKHLLRIQTICDVYWNRLDLHRSMHSQWFLANLSLCIMNGF